MLPSAKVVVIVASSKLPAASYRVRISRLRPAPIRNHNCIQCVIAAADMCYIFHPGGTGHASILFEEGEVREA